MLKKIAMTICDAISILVSSKSLLATGIYCVNMSLYAIRSTRRIHCLPTTKFVRDGLTYYANSWDGLLVLRPRHEPLVNAAVAAVARENEGGVFVNVGAHIGRYCIEYASSFDRTIAYEPTPATFSLLSRAVERHPVRERIRLSQACVTAQSGTILLQLSKAESQNSTVQDNVSRPAGSVVVPAVTLDDDLTDGDKRTIRLLLIDVEGAEDAVLEGARATLAVGDPTIIVEFLSDERRRRCNDFLESLGYRGTMIDQTNWLFARRQAHNSGNN